MTRVTNVTRAASRRPCASGGLLASMRGGGRRPRERSAQDRLLTLGVLRYTYTPSGHLAKKIDGAAITAYSYDAPVNVLTVTRPNGIATAMERK